MTRILTTLRLEMRQTDPDPAEVMRNAGGDVATAAVAEHLVADHEGVQTQTEWERFGPACLNYLQIGAFEVGLWVDTLHPVLEGLVLA